MKKAIQTTAAPAAIGPYSQAIETGNLLFLSGQLGIDPATGTFPEGIEAQTRQSLLNIRAILTEAGYEMSQVIKTTVLLADIADFAQVNEIYAANFAPPFPARSAFAVKTLPKGGLIEIEVIASR